MIYIVVCGIAFSNIILNCNLVRLGVWILVKLNCHAREHANCKIFIYPIIPSEIFEHLITINLGARATPGSLSIPLKILIPSGNFQLPSRNLAQSSS